MRVIDLGHPITNNMLTFPGDEPPVLKNHSPIESGYRSTSLIINSHNGTHIDAPAHIFKDGKYLEEYPNEIYFGLGIVIDATACIGREIKLEDIKKESLEKIGYVDYVLFRTDWSKKWDTNLYTSEFPVLSESLAYFLTTLNIKAVGFDTISADEIASEEMKIHKILLSSDILIIENLCNLDKVGEEVFCLTCLPLSFSNQDGSPTRVMAILEN